MKKDRSNIEHRIQLKKDEIVRYEHSIKNYSDEMMKKYGFPYFEKLRGELLELFAEQQSYK